MEHQDYNLCIGQALARINQILIKYRLSGKPLSAEKLKEEYYMEGSTDCFVAYMAEKIKQERVRGHITEGTQTHHKIALNKLKLFLASNGKRSLPFSDIEVSLFIDFDLWHIERLAEKDCKGHGARWNTQKAYRKYLELARKVDKKSFEWPFPEIIKKPKGKRPIFLSQAELKNMISLYEDPASFLTKTGKNVLRAFLVQCFTGLRFGDLQKVEKKQYQKKKIILKPEKTSESTGEEVRLYVHGPLQSILKDCKVLSQSKYLVPTHAEPTHNLHLKSIARMCRIQKKLTTHVARHTFATIFLERGGSVEVLQKILGRSKIETTMIYVHITNRSIEDQTSRVFDDFL